MNKSDALAFLSSYVPKAHPRADTALLCGSTAHDRATPASDVDVVLLFDSLPDGAARETLRVGGALIEAFLHDLGTLAYFITDLDGAAGDSTLATLIVEGVPVPGLPNTLLDEAKRIAAAALAAGPPPLPADAADRRRYLISSLADDLTADLAEPERVAVAADLYTSLADYTLRMAGQFSGKGKALPRRLATHDPALAADLASAVTMLIAKADAAPIQSVVDRALAPHGGRLVEDYRSTAPKHWRR